MSGDDNLIEIHRALGRIEGKQDAILVAQSDLKDNHERLEKRVNGLDTKLHWYSGAGAVLVFGVTFFKDHLLGVFLR